MPMFERTLLIWLQVVSDNVQVRLIVVFLPAHEYNSRSGEFELGDLREVDAKAFLQLGSPTRAHVDTSL